VYQILTANGTQESPWDTPTAPWSLQIRTIPLPGSPGPLGAGGTEQKGQACVGGTPKGPTQGEKGESSQESVSLAGRQRGEGLPGGGGHAVSRWPSLGGSADTCAASMSAEEGGGDITTVAYGSTTHSPEY
jgi:hypothetical protein